MLRYSGDRLRSAAGDCDGEGLGELGLIELVVRLRAYFPVVRAGDGVDVGVGVGVSAGRP
jgi:hypothetical protein